MSKRWFATLALVTVLLTGGMVGVLATTTSLATGAFGGDAPSRIPVPARSFSATFEDAGGTSVKGASKVTFNGEVFLYGRFGAGQVTIPFERIAQVEIHKAADPLKRTAVVTLNDGSAPVRVELEDDTPWYARTRFGNYKVEVRDLRKISGFTLVPDKQ